MAEESTVVTQSVGERLRELRLMAGLSQVALSRESGMAQSMVSALERGERGLTMDSYEKLVKVYGEAIEDLYPEQEEQYQEGYISTEEAGRRMVPPETSSSVRKLIAANRIPGVKKIRKGDRMTWRIPEDFKILPPKVWGVLSERSKNNIARQFQAGRKTGKQLAEEYGVDPSYPTILTKRGYPKI